MPPAGTTGVITVIDQYVKNNFSQKFSPTAYQHTANNLAWRTQKNTQQQFTMGGCMGCHGVAQLSGELITRCVDVQPDAAVADGGHDLAERPAVVQDGEIQRAHGSGVTGKTWRFWYRPLHEALLRGLGPRAQAGPRVRLIL